MSRESDLVEALSKTEGRAEALELDSARCHQLLDGIGVPRESPGARGERAVELSLSGRLEVLLDELETE